jgi:hypothetical protein
MAAASGRKNDVSIVANGAGRPWGAVIATCATVNSNQTRYIGTISTRMGPARASAVSLFPALLSPSRRHKRQRVSEPISKNKCRRKAYRILPPMHPLNQIRWSRSTKQGCGPLSRGEAAPIPGAALMKSPNPTYHPLIGNNAGRWSPPSARGQVIPKIPDAREPLKNCAGRPSDERDGDYTSRWII